MKQLLKYIHIAVLCAVVITALAVYLAYKSIGGAAADALPPSDFNMPALPKIFSFEEVAETAEISEAAGASALPQVAQTVLPEYADKHAANADFAGMLYIDGVMELPVMHTPAEPEFYLTHSFDKAADKHGTIFIDGRCSANPKSGNIIMYGHNMRDRSMFTPLMSYKSEDFYKKHPNIRFDTLFLKSEYTVFAAFSEELDGTAANPKDYFNVINFQDADEFNGFTAQLTDKALYKTDAAPKFGDKFITLMTCTNADEYGRMIVVALEN